MARLIRILWLGIFLITSSRLSGLTQETSNILKLLSSEGKVLFGNEPNSMLVIDYPENINRVQEYLDMVDILPQQVHIEARVAEVILEGEHALGVQWTLFAQDAFETGPLHWYSSSITGGITQTIPYKNTAWPPTASTQTNEDPFTITIFDENVNLVLNTLANRMNTTVLSAPSITTVNNREAQIKVIERIAWAEPQVTTVGEASTSTQVTWEINYEEVGILLKVTPTISEDGNISMLLEPEVSENNSNLTLTIQSGSDTFTYTVPNVDTREASTKVVVGNGQTIIIGGLIKNKVKKQETKIPLLGDIPYLGYLFKSTRDITDKTELLIFVSPTIIDSYQVKHMGRMKKKIRPEVEGKEIIPHKRLDAVLPVKKTPEAILTNYKEVSEIKAEYQKLIADKEKEFQDKEREANFALELKEKELKRAELQLKEAQAAEEKASALAEELAQLTEQVKQEAYQEAEKTVRIALEVKEKAFRQAEGKARKDLAIKERELKEAQQEFSKAMKAKEKALQEAEEETQKALAVKNKELAALDKESKSALEAKEKELRQIEKASQEAVLVKERELAALDKESKSALEAKEKELRQIEKASQEAILAKEKELAALDKESKATVEVKEKALRDADRITNEALKAKKKELEQAERKTQEALLAKEEELKQIELTLNKALQDKTEKLAEVQRETQKALEAKERELNQLKKALELARKKKAESLDKALSAVEKKETELIEAEVSSEEAIKKLDLEAEKERKRLKKIRKSLDSIESQL